MELSADSRSVLLGWDCWQKRSRSHDRVRCEALPNQSKDHQHSEDCDTKQDELITSKFLLGRLFLLKVAWLVWVAAHGVADFAWICLACGQSRSAH